MTEIYAVQQAVFIIVFLIVPFMAMIKAGSECEEGNPCNS